MKIKSVKSLGIQTVYSPEMESSNHNYILDSGAVHKNSHAIAYAAVIAYRCAWLKAHFFPEWMASVLTSCNSKKIPRYISMARTEGWRPTNITNLGRKPDDRYKDFDIVAFDINKLTPTFSVIGNILTIGLLSVKGIGDSDRGICDVKGPFESIDHFIEATGAGKTVIERLIRLRAFNCLAGHENTYALLQYYNYKYKKNTAGERKIIAENLKDQQGWDSLSISAERARQIQEYFNMYPKRKKIPTSFEKWEPEVITSLEEFNKLFPKDYKMVEILAFEKEYLGYNLSNPLSIYKTRKEHTIYGAMEAHCQGNKCYLEVIVVERHMGVTEAKKTPYCRLEVTDGLATTTVFIWNDNLESINPDLLNKDRAILIPVKYQPTRKSFSMVNNSVLIPLTRKDDE